MTDKGEIGYGHYMWSGRLHDLKKSRLYLLHCAVCGEEFKGVYNRVACCGEHKKIYLARMRKIYAARKKHRERHDDGGSAAGS